MSTTIRISRRDKEALENLGRRLGTKTMAQTLRKAISLAQDSDDRSFRGNAAALAEALKLARASSAKKVRISENVDEELTKVLYDR